jgi:phosphatidylinositol kinase/protein kinase (PI-3  family)
LRNTENSFGSKKLFDLFFRGFIALVKHSEKILILVEMMFCGHGKNLPCFQNQEYTIEALKYRFKPKPGMKKHDYMRHVDELIEQSIDNWRTRWYDRFQYYFQGIFY